MHTYRNCPAVFQFLVRTLQRIPVDNPRAVWLPFEVLHAIVNDVVDRPAPPLRPVWSPPRHISPHPAETPPKNGAVPLMKLPTELRREIFAESLPARDVEYHPICEDDKAAMRNKAAMSANPKRPLPKKNRISDLMTISNTLCAEITEVMYEERVFVIHVHSGLQRGGIEFLEAGRQPLQYKDSDEDQRFWKFTNLDEFGFRRLKRIKVRIHPPANTEKEPRHTAINTYFMNLALCRLLERSGEKENRITNLSIEFAKPKNSKSRAGRAAIMRAEQYWWDRDKQQPRETSIYRLPNIELVLRPFAILTGCHAVSIKLPGDNVANHAPTAAFVEKLKQSITSKDGTLFSDDDLEHKIECARAAMEEYVNYTLHSTGYHEVAKMTDAEIQEDNLAGSDDSSSDRDREGAGGGGRRSRKHDLSPPSKRNLYRSKLRIGYDSENSETEREIMLVSRREEEERQMQQAIEASIREVGVRDPLAHSNSSVLRSALHDEEDASEPTTSGPFRESASRRSIRPRPKHSKNNAPTNRQALVGGDPIYTVPENTIGTTHLHQPPQSQHPYSPFSWNPHCSQHQMAPTSVAPMQAYQSSQYPSSVPAQPYSSPTWGFVSETLPSSQPSVGSSFYNYAQSTTYPVIGRTAQDTEILDLTIDSDCGGAAHGAQPTPMMTSVAEFPETAASFTDLAASQFSDIMTGSSTTPMYHTRPTPAISTDVHSQAKGMSGLSMTRSGVQLKSFVPTSGNEVLGQEDEEGGAGAEQ